MVCFLDLRYSDDIILNLGLFLYWLLFIDGLTFFNSLFLHDFMLLFEQGFVYSYLYFKIHFEGKLLPIELNFFDYFKILSLLSHLLQCLILLQHSNSMTEVNFDLYYLQVVLLLVFAQIFPLGKFIYLSYDSFKQRNVFFYL